MGPGIMLELPNAAATTVGSRNMTNEARKVGAMSESLKIC
jgi:hypothetical protein